MAERLVAWLYGTPVAVLAAASEHRITLDWRDEGIERWGRGSRVLSVSLPLGSPIAAHDMRGLDFFENLLPEGPTLAAMAAWTRVPPADTYGILSAFGRDCAGAIALLPEGERPGADGDSGYLPTTEDELVHILTALDTVPLGAAPERGFRPSLPGFQRKALLGRAADGAWQRPYGDAPSTWILKPDGPHALAANEAACLHLATACGLAAPEIELLDVDGLHVLAVQRYDRRATPAGPIRVHQEDGCQATATPPALKYEEHGGPSLHALAAVLRDFGDPADVTALLRRATFNMAIGNTDAHAKNFSILHHEDGVTVSLAPAYDLLSTVALGLTDDTGRSLRTDTRLGQRVGGQGDIREVSADDLVEEAATWGIRRPVAKAVVADMVEQVIDAIRAAPDERIADRAVLDTIHQQAERVGRSRRSLG